MKKEVTEFVYACLTCQKSNNGHQKLLGMMQPLSIHEWKWDIISMDFVTSLRKRTKGCDSILVIVDRMTKLAHFILIKISYPLHKLSELYIENIFRLHGIPPSIVLDRYLRFMLRFWHNVQEVLGTKQSFSSAYYLHTDSHTKRIVQSLEDTLRACMLKQGCACDNYLSLIEFTCNNIFRSSIEMACLRRCMCHIPILSEYFKFI